MGYYDEVYLKRLNRYGNTFQSRVQGQREREFEDYLLKSIYRTDIIYNEELIPCTLEPYSQDETDTFAYLLTEVDVILPAGQIFDITNYNDITNKWMVYYLENMKASGYNRYIMIKITHEISWIDRYEIQRKQWVHLAGPKTSLRDQKIGGPAVYLENNKLNSIIMPLNEFVNKDDYIEIGEGNLKEQFVVTGYDRLSTPGVQYVSLDPVYERDLTPAPEKTEEDSDDDFFWLDGGAE